MGLLQALSMGLPIVNKLSVKKRGTTQKDCFGYVKIGHLGLHSENRSYIVLWSLPKGILNLVYQKQTSSGTPLLVQWLRLCTPKAGGPSLIRVGKLGVTCHD